MTKTSWKFSKILGKFVTRKLLTMATNIMAIWSSALRLFCEALWPFLKQTKAALKDILIIKNVCLSIYICLSVCLKSISLKNISRYFFVNFRAKRETAAGGRVDHFPLKSHFPGTGIPKNFPRFPGKCQKWQFLLFKNSRTSHFWEIMH